MFVISVIVKSTRPTSPERLYERFPGHLVFVSDATLTLNILGSGKNGVVSTKVTASPKRTNYASMFSFPALEPPPFNPQRMVGYIKK